MESAALSIPLFTISKTLKFSPNPLHRHFSKTHLTHTLRARISSACRTRCIAPGDLKNSREWFLISFSGMLIQNPPAKTPILSRLACISSSSSARALGSGGAGDGIWGGGGGSGGGDGGSDGGGSEAKSVAGESEELSAVSPEVIILDVGGMTCGGCAASVKRILESQPQVSSASVNLATETAVVWATPEVKGAENWQKQLGERLAKHLTSCGFKSNLRDRGYSFEGDIHS